MSVKKTSIKVFGIKVAEVEVEQEPISIGSRERPKPKPREPEMSIDTDLLVPLMLDSMVSLYGVAPEMISFGHGVMLERNADIDSDVACRALRFDKKLKKEDIVEVVLGFAGQTNLFTPESRLLRGGFRNHVATVVDLNWKKAEQPVPTS